MWKTLFSIAVGVILGIAIGGSGVYFMLEGKLGDKYEIVRPKIKGDSNTMHIDQENLKQVDNKTLKWKRNGKIKRKYRKNRFLPREGESE